MTAHWISSVFLLLLGLVSQPGAAAAADAAAKEATPAVVSIGDPTVLLLWSVIGSEDGVAVGDGFVLTTDAVPGLVNLFLPLYSLADPGNDLALNAATQIAAPITEVALEPITPNPNHGEANVAFALPRASHVHLAIFDLQGRQLQVLADGVMEAGPHSVAWRGVREPGARVAGVYFVQLATPERVINRRMVVTY